MSLEALEQETTRIPANLYGLVRQSIDTREKVLDWCLAIAVSGTIAWVFRDQLASFFYPNGGVNAGRQDNPTPNQDVATAFPTRSVNDFYQYNMPRSRTLKYTPGPSVTAVPVNPSSQPAYP